MAAQIVFKVKLRAHGEVSPAIIQRLRAIRLYIDNLFGPPNATVRDEADVSYEQIQANGIDRIEGWDLACRQPVFVDDPDFSYSQPHDFSQDCTEESSMPFEREPSVGLSLGMTLEDPVDTFPSLQTPSLIFSGPSAQDSPTHRYDHEYTTGIHSMAERGNSAGPSGTTKWRWKAYNPDTSNAGSAQEAKGPKRRKE